MSDNSLNDAEYAGSTENPRSGGWMQEFEQRSVMEILESKGVYDQYPGQRSMTRKMVDYIQTNEGFTAAYREIAAEYGWRPEKARSIAEELEDNGLAEVGEELVHISPEFPEKEKPPFQEYSNL